MTSWQSKEPTQNSDPNTADKQGFAHFMLKEIYEQPEVVRNCLATYLNPDWRARHSGIQHPFNLGLPAELYTDLEQIHILACGTSRHAGLVAQYWLEQIAGIPTRVRSAAEFTAAPLPLTPNTLTISVTQSGETADTLAAIAIEKNRRAQQRKPFQLRLLGITNQAHSSLTQQVDYTLLTQAGAEVGVAATKTFLTQLVVFLCLSLDLAYRREIIREVDLAQILVNLRALPEQIEMAIHRQADVIRELARTLSIAQHCIILGHGINRAIALEGALKMKETSYLHAEGYASGEFLHGPIALLDPSIPVVAIVVSKGTASASPLSIEQTVLATVDKSKNHGAPMIGIISEPTPSNIFEHQLILPGVDEILSPLLTVIPLQLMAYHIAALRGLDVDRPRNITKTLM